MASIIVGTNSYVTEAELTIYATDRGVTIAGDTAQLLIKAMDWLEIQPFSGSKYDYDQDLQFPRYPYSPQLPNVVPDNIEKAQIVAALEIDSGADLLATIDRAVKREKVDVIEVEYQENASEVARYPELDMLIAEFLTSTGGSFGVVRG